MKWTKKNYEKKREERTYEEGRMKLFQTLTKNSEKCNFVARDTKTNS